MEPLQTYLSYAYERELSLSRCYVTCAEVFEEHSGFLLELAEEEKQHGALILTCLKSFDHESQIPFVAEIDIIADLFEFIEKLKRLNQELLTEGSLLTLDDMVKLVSILEKTVDNQTVLEYRLTQIPTIGKIGESYTHHYERVVKWAQSLGIAVENASSLDYYIDILVSKKEQRSTVSNIPPEEVLIEPVMNNFLDKDELLDTSSIVPETLPADTQAKQEQEESSTNENFIQSSNQPAPSSSTSDCSISENSEPTLLEENRRLKKEIEILKQAIAILAKQE